MSVRTCSFRALSLSGRLTVRMATRPSRSTRMVSAMGSLLLSSGKSGLQVPGQGDHTRLLCRKTHREGLFPGRERRKQQAICGTFLEGAESPLTICGVATPPCRKFRERRRKRRGAGGSEKERCRKSEEMCRKLSGCGASRQGGCRMLTD